jgi:membrane-associated phospholipid phosphatase
MPASYIIPLPPIRRKVTMPSRSNFHAVRLLVLASLFAATPALAFDEDDYKTLSHVLAIGLPAVAAGISVAHDDTPGLVQLAKSEAFTLAATEVLKLTVHETRPNGRDDKSFPSGHTAVSFAAAQYMQMRGGWEYGVPAYIAAVLAGYSRVRADEHYWKDVAAGAALGIASSYYFTDTGEWNKFSVLATPNAVYAQVSTSW